MMQNDSCFRQDLFAGKVALVTGGTSGIGEATAGYLSELGARIIAIGLDAEACHLRSSETVVIREVDVTQRQAVIDLFESIPRLDMLINCAGISLPDEEHGMAGFDRVLAVNLTATMHLCECARILLEKSHGTIVNISSVLGVFGNGDYPAYSASKGGINQLTKSLAIAWAASEIRVNAVAPGWIRTPLAAAIEAQPELEAAITTRIPAQRWGKAREVAKAIAFLCSPAAGYITGAVVPVDAGYTIN